MSGEPSTSAQANSSNDFASIADQAADGSPALSQGSFNQGYYERFFVETRKLGRGFRGSVYLCQHVLDDVRLGEYAVKKVAVGDNHAWLVRMLREVHLLEKLHHPNIIDYKHAWLEYHRLTNFGPEVPCLFILMECANGGNLEEYINVPCNASLAHDNESGLSSKKRAHREKRLQKQCGLCDFSSGAHTTHKHYLKLDEVWMLFMDVCRGLAHLHRNAIIHRDLKPSNLLLHYPEPNSRGTMPTVLISDFGECEVLSQLTERERTGATGTMEFMAPELLTVDNEGKYFKDYSPKSDMWSLGMVLYYMCYSNLPYGQIEDVDLLKDEILQFTSVSFPENDAINSTNTAQAVPHEARNLITKLLARNPKSRPSCDEILISVGDAQSYFSNNDGNGIPEASSFQNITIGMSNTTEAAPLAAAETASTSTASHSGHDAIGTSDDMTPSITSMQRRRRRRALTVDTALNNPGVISVRSTNGTHGTDETNFNNGQNSIILSNGPAVQQESDLAMEPSVLPQMDNGASMEFVRLLPSAQTNEFMLVTLLTSIVKSYQLPYFCITFIKILMCITACEPYMVSAWVLYPMVGLAMLDLWYKSWSITVILMIIHLLLWKWLQIFPDKVCLKS